MRNDEKRYVLNDKAYRILYILSVFYQIIGGVVTIKVVQPNLEIYGLQSYIFSYIGASVALFITYFILKMLLLKSHHKLCSHPGFFSIIFVPCLHLSLYVLLWLFQNNGIIGIEDGVTQTTLPPIVTKLIIGLEALLLLPAIVGTLGMSIFPVLIVEHIDWIIGIFLTDQYKQAKA